MNELPARIFFDTNVIQSILEYNIFDEECIRFQRKLGGAHQKKEEDINALRYIYLCNLRGAFQFIISYKVVEELSKSSRYSLIRWGFEFLDYSNGFYEFEDKGIKLRYGLALINEKDRKLLIDAINMNCDSFLTIDYKTVWRHKKKVKKIRILRPTEFWEMLRPYSSLFY
ncbi:MAG: hypothetical protein ACTSRL_03015 [Candidatus Helarchaeota archaeon]